jgi:chaperonin cofactor prefoldin
MKLDKIVSGLAQTGDPGAFIRQELEEGISPITQRIDRLEKKVDMLILTLKSVDESLKRLQPLYDFVTKLPFFKK